MMAAQRLDSILSVNLLFLRNLEDCCANTELEKNAEL